MINPLLIIPLVIGFFITFLVMPTWIKRAKNAGLSGKDINKYEKKEVAEAGGIVVIIGFLVAVLSYVAIKTFFFNTTTNLIEIFALTTSLLILAGVGMTDDILGWKIGLSKKVRIILAIIAAVPLIVINAGQSSVFGINFGLIYPIVLIPLGIVATSTTFNILAGYNGLEAGQGIIFIGALSLVAYFTGSSWLALIGLCMVVSLLGFLFYNWNPAKIFPGDVMTYSVGGLIGTMAILGNFEKIAIFFFIPYIIEVVLKLRGNLKIQSFGKPNKDNSLELPYKKICGLEHVAIWILKKIKKDGKAYEKEVVLSIYGFQILIILIGFIIFRNSIF